MQLAVVVGSIWSSAKHPAYDGRKQMLVQRVDLDHRPLGHPTVAIDYVNAGVGDTVLIGAAPGLASVVFKIKIAPIQTLIMGIVDRVEATGHEAFGISVSPPQPAGVTPAETSEAPRPARSRSRGGRRAG